MHEAVDAPTRHVTPGGSVYGVAVAVGVTVAVGVVDVVTFEATHGQKR